MKENIARLPTATPPGLHEFVAANVLARYARSGMRAADLGAGPGAMSQRLGEMGCTVLAVDRDPHVYKAGFPFVTLDFNEPGFATQLGIAEFELVVAVEVIEHVESPIGFLRNVGRLLASGGVAVITTPNVDSLPARFKFFLTGKLRTMDEHSDPTHISPVFWDLFGRQFLPRAGVKLRERFFFPPDGYQLTRAPIAFALRHLARFSPADTVLGDHHVVVIERAS